MSTGLTALFSKFLSGGAKAFGMTFGSAMGQKAPKYDPGVKGLAQSFLATSSAKDDTSFSEVLAKMQGTTVNPTAASVPISTEPIVAKNAINKLFFAAKPHGFFVPQTISLYHLVEKPSGSNLFISSEKIKNSS